MKDVMISIKPKWCELIASSKKTIEVRKTRPKIETPFKCYIYCTMGRKNGIPFLVSKGGNVCFGDYRNACHCDIDGSVDWFIAEGKIIGEFMCDSIRSYIHKKENGYYFDFSPNEWEELLKEGGLSTEQILNYVGESKHLYGWHISDLVIYDEPKELWEFRNIKGEQIKRPFQSWGYVEG